MKSRSRSSGRPKVGVSDRRRLYSSPWNFYRRPRCVASASDLYGRPVSLTVYRRNGRLTYRATPRGRCSLPVDSLQTSALRRRLAKEIAGYRTAGLLSETDLAVIDGVLRLASLAEIAATLGVSRQAVHQRIHRLKERAPRVWLFWVRKRSFGL